MVVEFHQKLFSSIKFRLVLFMVVFILRDLFDLPLKRTSRWKTKSAQFAENISRTPFTPNYLDCQVVLNL